MMQSKAAPLIVGALLVAVLFVAIVATAGIAFVAIAAGASVGYGLYIALGIAERAIARSNFADSNLFDNERNYTVIRGEFEVIE
jgi:hypothetical protein